MSFRWDPNPQGSAQGSISLPVILNGKAMWFQLDTGTNVDIVYGDIADKAGWVRPNGRSFRATDLSIGTTHISQSPMSVWRDQPIAETSGEIGLANLVGKVTVIDFPGRRFCLFAPGEISSELKPYVEWVEADLRNGKFFVPVSSPGFTTRSIIFDTGSSELPLWVDLARWRSMTGSQTSESGTYHIAGNSFTKPVMFNGEKSIGSVLLGDINLGVQVVYTKEGDPEFFSHFPYLADGIMGNAAFKDRLIIIDLADDHTRLGLSQPR